METKQNNKEHKVKKEIKITRINNNKYKISELKKK